MITLSELQEDALGEIFNIGVGRAAVSLSQIVDDEIKLSAPVVKILSRPQVIEMLGASTSGRLSSVRQDFHGALDASGLLIFPEINAIEIVRRMVGSDLAPDVFCEYESEAMSEVGNIILNACMSSLANMMQITLTSDFPIHNTGDYQTIIPDSPEIPVILLIHIDLIISKQNLNGNILFLVSVKSLNSLLDYLDQYLTSQGLV